MATTRIKAFPALGEEEFEGVWRAFWGRWVRWGGRMGDGGLEVRVEKKCGREHLSIIRSLSPGIRQSGDGEQQDWDQDEIPEDRDEEALLRAPPGGESGAYVQYDVLLSPTYHVPVLWFSIHGLSGTQCKGLEWVYENLVTPGMLDEVKGVGVLGGVGLGNHPLTDIPAYFVHPCNTADAMRDVCATGEVGVERYLAIWLGLVGGCVGVWVPRGVMEEGGE
ncbi:hypothetical protein FGG08_007486 [Glutinoglossum americanum]|uniref:Ubiquitin-like-conjugating enzyme ATG10 n=1 Tax=Glutinoglossum americanum TaxID=1670608 RepID=A0A9P8HQP2_9PEZI|nr:hypothetical protein FGG08_007486 [Glutinoglossum americanum]